MADRTWTQEETLALLNTKAKELGDNFFVRIFRKQHMSGLPESILTFDNVQLQHLTSPEQWLPQLAGGGPLFMFQVYHSNDRGVMLGGLLHFSVPTNQAPPKEIERALIGKPGWPGPKEMLYPPQPQKPSESPLYAISSGLPPASPSGNSAANNVPGGGPGAVQLRDPVFERNAQLLQQLEQERQKLQREREEWAEQQRKDREDLAEQKRKAELDAVRRESEAKLEAMKRELMDGMRALQTQTAAPPKADLSQTIASITTAVTPILLKMFETQNELRIAMLKQQDQIAAATAESNRTLMAAMLQKPSIDPVVERLFSDLKSTLEKSAGQQVPQSTMLHSMADAMASMTQTTMDLVQTAADLNLGGGRPEEHPALKAMREGVKAVQSIFAGYQAALPKGPQQQQPQQRMPAGYYQPPAQLPAHPHQVAPQPAAAPPGQVASAPPPAAGPAPVSPEQALAQLPPAKDVVELMENMFKAQVPVAHLVQTFLAAFNAKDPALERALSEVDYEVEKLFANRLAGFVMANPNYVPYMNELLSEVNRQGEAAGIFEPSEDGGDDDDGDEERDAA